MAPNSHIKAHQRNMASSPMMNREPLDLYQANAFAGCAPIHDRLFPMLEIKVGATEVIREFLRNVSTPIRRIRFVCARRERPGNCCSANKRGELAPPHVEHAM